MTLTQMVNFPALIPGCDSQSLVLLGLCISFDASICSKMAISALRNSDHVVVSVSSDFQSNLKGDVPWENIFKFLASAAATEF